MPTEPPPPAEHDSAPDVRVDSLPAPAAVRIADYPVLRELAWSTEPDTELSPAEAFGIYERQWRHIDPRALGASERALIDRLTATVGHGVLLV